MAYGDVGGPVTELTLTCKAVNADAAPVARGDAVKLTGAYAVDNAADAEDAVFGQALADVETADAAVPVKVRGVCVFSYVGAAPVVDGATGVVASAEAGKVKTPASGAGRGLVLKVNAASSLVHVLL